MSLFATVAGLMIAANTLGAVVLGRWLRSLDDRVEAVEESTAPGPTFVQPHNPLEHNEPHRGACYHPNQPHPIPALAEATRELHTVGDRRRPSPNSGGWGWRQW